MKRGDRYGNYDIIRLIGQGSMGTVYLATRRDTGEQVAIKIVAYADTEIARENIAVEERGARLQKDLTDPRVVKVYRIHRTDQDLNVEMEYVDGRDLSDSLNEGAMPAGRAVEIAVQLCEMLCNLGGGVRPVVHGDLKPRNIRVRPDGAIKVMDFGIAKETSHQDGTVNLFQTPQYASPERLESDKASEASDLWSVSVMLYEMVAGYHPFQAASSDHMRQRIRTGIPSNLPGSVPPDLVNILHRALSRQQQNRYDGPDDMLRDLQRFQAGEPTFASEPNPDMTQRTVPPPPSFVPPPPPAPVGPAGGFPHWRKVVVGLLLIVLLLVLVPQFKAWSEVRDLTTAVGREGPVRDEIWNRFDVLRNKPFNLIPMTQLKAAIKKKLSDAGEKPIKDYLRDQEVSAGWEKCANALEKAKSIDPADPKVVGNWHICQGHALRNRFKKTLDRRLLYQAIEHFREAAKSLPLSPDPYLGLARIYYQILNDMEKGDEAIEQARQREFPVNDFHQVLKADALKSRGDQSLTQAAGFRKASALEQEKQNLESARQDYQVAIQIYKEHRNYTKKIPKLIQETGDNIRWIEERLATLNKLETAK